MKKYQLRMIVELNKGELSGTELLTAIIFAKNKEEAENISEIIQKKYIDKSMIFKHLPKFTTIGTTTSLIK